MSAGLEIWTVYEHPSDWPQGTFVARKWLLDQRTEQCVTGRSLEEVRGKLPPGLYRMPRSPTDDPVIVETWF